jgi:hypothetical protein
MRKDHQLLDPTNKPLDKLENKQVGSFGHPLTRLAPQKKNTFYDFNFFFYSFTNSFMHACKATSLLCLIKFESSQEVSGIVPQQRKDRSRVYFN